MSRNGWIALWSAGICAAFAAGVTIGRTRKPEIPHLQPAGKIEAKKPESDRVCVLLSNLASLRHTLAEKEQKISDVEAELAEVRAKLPPPLSPEEEKKKKEQEKRLKRDERWQAINERSKGLRAKILQRKDKALRAQGLEELFGLLQSDHPEELLLALSTFPNLPGINLDKESLKPHIVTALSHEDPEIRLAALNALFGACAPNEMLDIVLRTARDPSLEVRRQATDILTGLLWGEERKEVTSTLRALVQDGDEGISGQAMDALWERSRNTEQMQEMEDLAIELSNDPAKTQQMVEWLARRDTVSAKVAQRLVEMYDEGQKTDDPPEWTERHLSDDAKPIAVRFCLRVVKDSTDYFERRSALSGLSSIGDPSVIPELEQIARSHDAEGIEKELAQTIAVLRSKLEEQ